MTTRRLGCGAAAAVVVTVLAAETAAAELIDRVLAIAAGRVVTLSDAHAALATGLVDASGADDQIAAAMSALIDRELVLAEADRYAVPEPDEAALAARLVALRAAVAGRAGGRPLAELGLDDGRLREIARQDLRIQAYYGQRFGGAQPSDAEVEAYYNSHPEEFTRGGVQLPLAEVRDAARQRLADERRTRVVDEWLAGLRRRADVNVLYLLGR